MKWYQSLKTQIVAALIFQLLLVVFVSGFSLFQLDLRKHDYAVLNLSGQLRVISQALFSQSRNYKRVAPRDYASYDRDLNLYAKDLQKNINSYSAIIRAFEERNLPAELIGADEAIYCNWDQQSVNQLSLSANTWYAFETGLQRALGDDKSQPRLEAAAEYIIEHGETIIAASDTLARSFQIMMEDKLDSISYMNSMAIAGFLLINFLILLGLARKVFLPLDNTRRSFSKVANGDLNYKVSIDASNEIGLLAQSFNSLTQRLSTLFRLTDRIHQASNLDDSLKFFCEEFKELLPIDWVGMIRCVPGTNQFTLERMYTDFSCELYENQQFHINENILRMAAQNNRPVNINQLSEELNTPLFDKLTGCGLHSVLAIPLECLSSDIIILLLASRLKHAYAPQHLDLLDNISAQLSHSLDKTIGMEGLVISTIEGLAKLAESRDPETGDHLMRMSLYSAIIAEQLAKDSPYSEMVTPAYIRDIFRFAPMHDIGKVGIEDSILLKPGKLSEQERAEMEKHPTIGARVLQRCEKQMNALGHSIFTVGIEIAGYHHEKYDGTGYPNRLKGQDIPLSARIVAVADVFDALTSKRPYKEAWPLQRALEVMREESQRHFDPVIVRALEAAMPRIVQVYTEHKHI